MAARQTQLNALIDAVAAAIRSGSDARAAATATGLRRAVWAALTPPQQARLLDVARRRARKGEKKQA